MKPASIVVVTTARTVSSTQAKWTSVSRGFEINQANIDIGGAAGTVSLSGFRWVDSPFANHLQNAGLGGVCKKMTRRTRAQAGGLLRSKLALKDSLA
jgi:hypothetical protein